MARSISQIQEEIINTAILNGIQVSDNKLSIRRIWTYVIAVCIYSLERLFDIHKAEINSILDTKRPSQVKWYQEMALKFQFGHNLPYESIYYDNTGLTQEEVDSSKIIARCVVNDIGSKMNFKIVKKIDEEFIQLTDEEKLAFKSYMDSVKDAGIRFLVTSLPPDELRYIIDIYYDPMVLNATGDRLDGSSTQVVPKAINDFIKNLPFNGEYSNSELELNLRSVEGVKIPDIRLSEVSYGAFAFSEITQRYTPDSGYLNIASNNLQINYIPYV